MQWSLTDHHLIHSRLTHLIERASPPQRVEPNAVWPWLTEGKAKRSPVAELPTQHCSVTVSEGGLSLFPMMTQLNASYRSKDSDECQRSPPYPVAALATTQNSPCPVPQVSTSAQCSSPGSRQHSITSLQVVSGVTGTSVTRGSSSPTSSANTRTIIWNQNTTVVSLRPGEDTMRLLVLRVWGEVWDDVRNGDTVCAQHVLCKTLSSMKHSRSWQVLS